MKHTFKIIALLLTGAILFHGCGKEIELEITPVETPGQGTQVKTYTMSVVAGKGETGTKALALEGSTLNATWKAGEQ